MVAAVRGAIGAWCHLLTAVLLQFNCTRPRAACGSRNSKEELDKGGPAVTVSVASAGRKR